MCGITGYISINKPITHSDGYLKAAVSTLNKRGPDHMGFYKDKNCELGHARLSIIDTSSEANQPMKDKSGRYIIIFNGEIYNFKELKNKLLEKGYQFSTQSDTEVVLYSYIEYGEKCIEKFNGFFGFCIYDSLENSSFLARDRYGIKQLYYSTNNEHLIFGSELKALLAYPVDKTIDTDSLNMFFRYNYIPAPYSILKSCKKLLPGECIKVKNNKITVEKYYEYYNNTAPSTDSYKDAQIKIEELLYSSVESRMVSDVPLGTFLSGGVDSSIISLIASRFKKDLNTFSIGFPDEPLFDESSYAEEVAKHIGSKHHTFQLTNNTLYQHLEDILDYMDEPFADSSAINVFLLSKRTKEHVTVSLSGDGADELFSGYNKHAALLFADQQNFQNYLIKNMGMLFNNMPSSRNSKIGNLGRKLSKLNTGLKLNPLDRYEEWASFMNKNDVSTLTQNKKIINPIKDLSFNNFNDYLYADFNLVLANDMLKKVDLMSMANSLEVRTPFLDHQLVEYVFSLPTSYKIDSSTRKKILKDTFRKDLPKIVFERKKHGFEVPLEKWFQNELSSYLKDKVFNNNPMVNEGLIDQTQLSKIEFSLNKGNSGDTVLNTWALITLDNWFRKNLF